MKRVFKALCRGTAVAGCLICVNATAKAESSYQVIYYGLGPIATDLIADTAGNLYGATSPAGGVFRLTAPPQGSLSWTMKTLYTFGQDPASAGGYADGGVSVTSTGAILGTLEISDLDQEGSVYRLAPSRPATFTVLHAFTGTPMTIGDGAEPLTGLTLGPNKLFYGTTGFGGVNFLGTVYAVSPSVTAPRYSVLHRFGAAGDGSEPGYGRLSLDSQGRLYGVTMQGGAHETGTVYMMQFANGGWKEQVVYSFQAQGDLSHPSGNVVVDSKGTIYGCASGGAHNKGGVFQLTPPATASEPWTESIIYSFGTQNDDPDTGLSPCGLALDPTTGQLLGSTYLGGRNIKGAVFELNPPAGGGASWTRLLIHSFTGTPHDGQHAGAAPARVGNSYYLGNQSGVISQFTP